MFYLCTRVFLNKHLICLAKFITIFVLCVFIWKVFALVICLLDSQDTIWQETSKCWFSTVSQPELHPVRGSHGTGRKACVCASALIQQFTQSVIWLALCALSHHIQSCPGIAWQQLLHPWGRSGGLLYAHHAQDWVNAYCSTHYCFIIHIHCKP